MEDICEKGSSLAIRLSDTYRVVPWKWFIQLTFDDDPIDCVHGVLLQCIPAAESPNHMCPTSHLKLILFVAGSGLDNVDPERCVDRKSIR